MSTKTTKTFFPGSMTSFSVLMALDSRIPLSTILANSIEFSSGGPGSKPGEARGTSSAFTVNTPSFGVSANVRLSQLLLPRPLRFFPEELSLSLQLARSNPVRFSTHDSQLVPCHLDAFLYQ